MNRDCCGTIKESGDSHEEENNSKHNSIGHLGNPIEGDLYREISNFPNHIYGYRVDLAHCRSSKG
jgi:hypothetical protein